MSCFGVMRGLAWTLAACLVACEDPTLGTKAAFDASRPQFFAAPFPSDDLLTSEGRVSLAEFPNPSNNDLIRKAITLVSRDVTGFSLTGATFFSFSDLLGPLPSIAQTTSPDAQVFMMGVTKSAADFAKRRALELEFSADGGPFGASNMLALLPVQGRALLPSVTYAAVVMRGLKDAQGKRLGVAPAVRTLVAGGVPKGMSAAAAKKYHAAVATLREQKIDVSEIAALTVFTTDAATAGLQRVAQATKDVRLDPGSFTAREVFDEFCVFDSTVQVPSFQGGVLPFATEGGAWVFDASGAPVQQRLETSRVVVTVPRVAMPAGGYPTVVMIRTGAGGDRASVDRGIRNAAGEVLIPGTGPAREFARAGFASVMIDGVHGGIRNIAGGDEQFAVFNLLNAEALRDNLRQSAVELDWVAASLPSWTVDTGACGGATAAARLSADHLTLFGHSMGASIAPLALAASSRFSATILSGAGASWIENIVYKKKPLDVRSVAELLIGYASIQRTLTIFDPALTIVNWAIEPSDSQIYGSELVSRPVHTLMFQGIFDNYIRPRIANALTVAMELDLAGPELDLAGGPTDTDLSPVSARLQLLNAGNSLAYPVSDNRSGKTLVVTQHPGDAVEDAHEVAYQTEGPKTQYRCFLRSLVAGGPPTVVDPAVGCGERR